MILVCPSCGSKFNVPDGAIPPAGRKVKCAQCQHVWHATTADELKPPRPAPKPASRLRPHVVLPDPTEIDAGAAAKAAAIRRAVVEEDVPAPQDAEEDLFDEGAEPVPASSSDYDELSPPPDDDLDDDFGDHGEPSFDEDDSIEVDEDDILARRRADLRRDADRQSRVRKRQLISLGWGLLLVVWLVVLFAIFFMKETVTDAFPGTNQLYEFFSGDDYADRFRPEEGEKLTPPITETIVYVTAKLHGDRTRIEIVDGKQQLMIRGFVENTGNRAANVPLVEISIKDAQGALLQQWNYAPPGLVLRRRSKLEFETMLHPVPLGTAAVEVRSLDGTRSNNEAESKL